MKTVTLRHALFLAAALAAAVLTGCADVHQNPAASTITGQPDASAAQSAGGSSQSPTNVPF